MNEPMNTPVTIAPLAALTALNLIREGPQIRMLNRLPAFKTYRIFHADPPRIFFLKGFLSQWFNSPFTATHEAFGKPVDFKNCEQFMMASKAVIFDDVESFEKIMAAGANPRIAKDLGRKVKNFDHNVWDQVKLAVVTMGNTFKFTQNPQLAIQLKMTHGYVLLEANLYDKVWGTGVDIDDPRLVDMLEFPGENLLGRALMQVREVLLQADPRFTGEDLYENSELEVRSSMLENYRRTTVIEERDAVPEG
jgi:hypothetical protein